MDYDQTEIESFARWLAKLYGGMHPLLDYEDAKQIALIAGWRYRDEPQLRRKNRMRWAILTEIRKLYSPDRIQPKQISPIEEEPEVSAIPASEDTMPSEEAFERIYDLASELPDDEFQAFVLRVNGIDFGDVVGMSKWRLRSSFRKARKHLAERLRELGVTA